jgi:hypothetical protein
VDSPYNISPAILICPDGQITNFLSSPFRKNILIFRRPKSVYNSAVHPTEGRFANVTDAGLDAMDAEARKTSAADADGEVVWS